MIIETYSPMKTAIAKGAFKHTFVEIDDHTKEEWVETKRYNYGAELKVMALVKSKTCFSGWGYVVCDDELEDVFIVDKALLNLNDI